MGGVTLLEGVVERRVGVAVACVGVAVLMGKVEFLEKELERSARLNPLKKLVFSLCKRNQVQTMMQFYIRRSIVR